MKQLVDGLLRKVKVDATGGRVNMSRKQLDTMMYLLVAECIEAVSGANNPVDALMKRFPILDDAPIKEVLSLDEGISRLDSYPRIAAVIKEDWGRDRGRQFMYDLIIDSRNRANSEVQGFPTDVALALMDLLTLHDELFPAIVPVESSKWNLK